MTQKFSPYVCVKVQTQAFSAQTLYDDVLSQNINQTGAVVTFIGKVREFGDLSDVEAIELSHYEGMTQGVITAHIHQAIARWPVLGVSVIHRVGRLKLNDVIVGIAVSSSHRQQAFLVCEYVINMLKNDVPLWKKEISSTDSVWVEQKANDINNN